MNILALDTSNKALSVALLSDGSLLAETTLNIKKNHSISLMPVIDFLMQQIDFEPADLDRIVVAQGPGSYTGLRVAVATAKVLASALRIDLVGVSSLKALVPDHVSGFVVPLIDARRNSVYAGFYDNGRAVKPDTYASFEAVLEQVQDQEILTFVGEVSAFAQQIKEYAPKAIIRETLPSAFAIGLAGQDMPAQAVDSFEPQYLKRVEAEENWLKTNQETGADYVKRV